MIDAIVAVNSPKCVLDKQWTTDDERKSADYNRSYDERYTCDHYDKRTKIFCVDSNCTIWGSWNVKYKVNTRSILAVYALLNAIQKVY